MANFKLEAEDAIGVTGYRVEQSNVASGDRLLGLTGNGSREIGSATFAFGGNAGVYNIIVGAFDESDGNARFELARDGNVLGKVVLNQNPGGTGISADTKVRRKIASEVTIARGDRFTLSGFENGKEHARLDFLRFVRVASPQAPVKSQSRVKANSRRAPRFETPKVIKVRENRRFAIDINARASNNDTEENGRLRYSISGGPDRNLFTLNSRTGVLQFKAAPNFEQPRDRNRNNLYALKVRARDSAGRRRERNLTFRVTNELERPQRSSGSGLLFQANQGQVIVDATSVQPRGDWTRTTVQNRRALLYRGPNSFGRALPNQQMEFRFRTDVGGQYFISLYGARDNSLVVPFENDRGNDLFVGIVNAETGAVVQRPTKLPTFLRDSNLSLTWGSTFSVSKELSPATVDLSPNTEYRFLITGRSAGYLFSRVTLSTRRALRNANAPESPTRSAGSTSVAEPIIFEAEDAKFTGYRLERTSFASGRRLLGLRGNGRGEKGRASFRFNEAPGRYDLLLGTFDQNDGISKFIISLRDGDTGRRRRLSRIKLDANLGSAKLRDKTAVIETVARGISLDRGDNISIQGFEDNGEAAQLDFLKLVPSSI
ncbi:MAG: cadherin repeat domain-containing protein [Synechococcus sp.]